MGVWTWLDRYQRSGFERAIAGPSARDLWDRLTDDSPANRAELGQVAGIHTHRAWHALHVALTGEEEGGAPPASHVVWTTPGADESGMTSARFIHASETVREVAAYLRTLDHERVVADLRAARALGVPVYSFEHWDGERDMVQCGLFERVFHQVRGFYLAAAAADQVVVVSRG